MRFNCDKLNTLREERQRSQLTWHEWFAWRPVRVKWKDCRWLETVERRLSYGSCYEYRAVSKKE